MENQYNFGSLAGEDARMKRISKKRLLEIKEEMQIRRLLCERAGGFWNGLKCEGGFCEKCGKPADWLGLHPHETKFRSKGGKLSMENSKMLCIKCGMKEHHLKVSEDK